MQGTYPRGGSMRDIFAQGRTIPVSNPTYPMANLNGSSYAAPLMYNRPTETLGGYDAQINPMTGQEVAQTNFAHGGLASLTRPSDDFARAMQSGIAAYAGGGEVKHFKAGDIVRTGTLLPGVTPAGLITYQVGLPTPDPQRAADEKAVREWFAQNVPAGTGVTPAAINQATGGNLTSADLARIGIGQGTGVFVPGNTAGTLNWSTAKSDDLDYITSLSSSPEWQATQSNLWGRFLDRAQQGLIGGLGGIIGGQIAGPVGAKIGAERLISAAAAQGVDPHWLAKKLGGTTTLESGKYVFTPSSGAPSVGSAPSDYLNTPEEYGGAGMRSPDEYELPEITLTGEPAPEIPYPIYEPRPDVSPITVTPAEDELPVGDEVSSVPAGTIFVQNKPFPITPPDEPELDTSEPSTGMGGGFNIPVPEEGVFRSAFDPMYTASNEQFTGTPEEQMQQYMQAVNRSFRPGPITPYRFQTAPEKPATPPIPDTPPTPYIPRIPDTSPPPETGQGAAGVAPIFNALGGIAGPYLQLRGLYDQPQGIAGVAPNVREQQPQYEEDPYAGLRMGLAGGGLAGLRGTYRAGGKLLRGPGDGMSDSIPAVIHGEKTQRAALADGEFVVPADVVSHIGNGSTDAGSRKLYEMMDRVRKARTGRTRQAPAISPDRYMPNA